MKTNLISILLSLITVFPLYSSVITDPLIVQQTIQDGILNADYIFEGEVLSCESFWNPSHNYIYTSNRVKITRVWENRKGEIIELNEGGIVEVTTRGGTVEGVSLSITHNASFIPGDEGMFLCKNTTFPIDPSSSVTPSYQYQLYNNIFCPYKNTDKQLTASFSGIDFNCIEELYELVDPNYIADCLYVNPDAGLSAAKYSNMEPAINAKIQQGIAGYGKLTYTFENSRSISTNAGSFFEFDIYIESNNNYWLDMATVNIKFNEDAFGTTNNVLNNITYYKGPEFGFYYDDVVSNLWGNGIFTINVLMLNGGVNRTFLPAGDSQHLVHVRMKIMDCSKTPDLSFPTSGPPYDLMRNGSEYTLNQADVTLRHWINFDFTDTDNPSLCGMNVSYFTPTKVNAGNFNYTGPHTAPTTIGGDIVTVSGAFLGNSGTIEMRNANRANGEGIWCTLDDHDIVSWQNNQIKFRVPGQTPINWSKSADLRYPGSGHLKITNANTGDVFETSTELTVGYSRTQIGHTDFKSKLFLAGPDQVVDENGITSNNGYSFHLHPNVISNSSAVACIREALDVWVCATDVRFQIDPIVSPLGDIRDNKSSISYGIPDNPLALAQTSNWKEICSENGYAIDYRPEIDIVINNDPTKMAQTEYDETRTRDLNPNKYDFYSIILHEFGHALNLNHVNQKEDIMYESAYKYSQLTLHWQRRIILSLDNIIGASETVYESSVKDWSSMSCVLSNPATMVPLPKSNCVVPTGTNDLDVIPNNHFMIKTTPNPFTNFSQLSFTLEKEASVKFNIYSISGNLLYETKITTFNKGLNSLDWSVEGFNSGIYIGILNINGETFPIRLIKL